MKFPAQPYPLAAPVKDRPAPKPAPAAAPAAAQPDADRQWWADENNAMRRLGVPVAVVFIFLRFSFLHEIITSKIHVNLYLLLLIGTPAALLAFSSGGLRRTFNTRAGKYWLLFTMWMLLATPFSTWRTDSGNTVMNFIRVTLPNLVVIAGLALTLKDCYRMMSAIAFASVLNVIYARSFAVEGAERLKMEFGSIGNSNDFAAHLLMVLPFLLWVALAADWKVMRVVAFAVFVFGMFAGASNGSRGAMLAAIAMAVFAFLRASGFTRLAILLVVPILAATIVILMPDRLLERYSTTFNENQEDPTDEAAASSSARKYLLVTSLDLTLQNPLVGVGPGQFANTEGRTAVQQGKRGVWQVSHNTYTQVSSENGVPALIFFVGAIVATFRILNSVYRDTRLLPQFRKLRSACYCLLLSLVGFSVAIFFLSLAYSLYLPVMTGLAIALQRAFQHEMASSPQLAPSASPGRC